MDNFDKVKKIVDNTGVSYEDAKFALENSNWDILEATIFLEKSGKLEKFESVFTTKDETQNNQDETVVEETKEYSEKIENIFKQIWSAKISVSRNSNILFNLPLLIFVILLLIIFKSWLGIVLIVLLFFKFRYNLLGFNFDDKVNNFLNKIYDGIDNIKNSFKSTN